MCCCKSPKCSILIEITTSGANISWPENNRLRDSVVQGIQMPVVGTGITLLSPTGKTLAADTVTQSSYLKLVNQNGTTLATIPLTHLQTNYNAPPPVKVNWTNVDPTQTVVQIGTGATGYNATHAMLFTVWLDCDNCGVPE